MVDQEMSMLLRVEMILTALIVVFVIVRNVNRGRLRLQYSLVWLLVALGMLIAAFFPGIIFWLCELTGIRTATNLIFLLGIVALLLIAFNQTVKLSKQADRITRLTQMVSLDKYQKQQKEEASHESVDPQE